MIGKKRRNKLIKKLYISCHHYFDSITHRQDVDNTLAGYYAAVIRNCIEELGDHYPDILRDNPREH